MLAQQRDKPGGEAAPTCVIARRHSRDALGQQAHRHAVLHLHRLGQGQAHRLGQLLGAQVIAHDQGGAPRLPTECGAMDAGTDHRIHALVGFEPGFGREIGPHAGAQGVAQHRRRLAEEARAFGQPGEGLISVGIAPRNSNGGQRVLRHDLGQAPHADLVKQFALDRGVVRVEGRREGDGCERPRGEARGNARPQRRVGVDEVGRAPQHLEILHPMPFQHRGRVAATQHDAAAPFAEKVEQALRPRLELNLTNVLERLRAQAENQQGQPRRLQPPGEIAQVEARIEEIRRRNADQPAGVAQRRGVEAERHRDARIAQHPVEGRVLEGEIAGIGSGQRDRHRGAAREGCPDGTIRAKDRDGLVHAAAPLCVLVWRCSGIEEAQQVARGLQPHGAQRGDMAGRRRAAPGIEPGARKRRRREQVRH